MRFLAVASGAAIGASLRYIVTTWLNPATGASIPWGTLTVNLLGCFIIGVFWGVGEVLDWAAPVRVFLLVGVLGSFTTFSSFGLESMHLLRHGAIPAFAVYVGASNLIGIALVFSGHALAKTVL